MAVTEWLRHLDRSGVREHLSEEELAIFDLLTTLGPELTEEERGVVKKVAGDLLTALKEGALILDWRLKEQARAAVRTVIKQSLDDLPSAYERAILGDEGTKYLRLGLHPVGATAVSHRRGDQLPETTSS